MLGWNPWHGCQKISPGCENCYMYSIDQSHGKDSHLVVKTKSFALPVQKKRDGSYKVAPHQTVNTCFSSDFFVKGADAWREEAWAMMRERRDLNFFFITKRIDRAFSCFPTDWGEGYPNVAIGCTVENQAMADYRLPIFRELPIRHKLIICAPLLEDIWLSSYLEGIEELSVGGESAKSARPCRYEWVLSLRQQCIERNISFYFLQTGSNFIKEGRQYYIPHKSQFDQARKAGINFQHKERFE